MTFDSAAQQHTPPAVRLHSAAQPFDCQPPATRPDRSCRRNLVLVVRAVERRASEFHEIASYVREAAPDIRPYVVSDRAYQRYRPDLAWRPTLVFRYSKIRDYRPARGAVFQGRTSRKSQEYAALERLGIPVPRWKLLTQDQAPNLDDFDPHVVCKPDQGGGGAEVKIKRKGRVRWKAPAARVSQGCSDLIVQQFIYTGQWPTSYRVMTLFGQVLYAWRNEADRSRRPLLGPDRWGDDASGGGMSIVSTAKGCSYELTFDREIIELGQRAHAAFPDVPVLGVDIVREQSSGKLYVLEVNACGKVWYFRSKIGQSIQQTGNFDLKAQFNGLRKAAHVLIDETRRRAC